MFQVKSCVVFFNFLLLLKVSLPLCQGNASQIFELPSVDWETELSLNSSFELGGKVQRSTFPKGFTFGLAGAAYQYEGAASEDGRGSSIWDVFTHTPGMIRDHTNGDVAVNEYHRFKEDIQIMKDLELDAFRFSISWPRVFPGGRGAINWAGVAYYNRFIDELLLQGIEPYATLYHWDLPQALELTGGWLNPTIVDAFVEYAELCFSLFGNKVKHWITFNEIHSFAFNGYYNGIDAPGRCSPPFGNCSAGNSKTEPFIVAHNALNSHALAVHIYRTKFQDDQKGLIGLTTDGVWFEPCLNTSDDIEAAQRAREYWVGWILDPLFFGDYPTSMRHYDVALALPKFTKEQSDLLKGSMDFVGLNQYTAKYAYFDKYSVEENDVTTSALCNGKLIGPETVADWFWIVPHGIRSVIGWITERYRKPVIFITENGLPNAESHSLQDYDRIHYHHDYMQNILLAIRDGSDVQGYFAWSLLDNFEWRDGYSLRFGFYSVDFKDNLQRRAKASAKWFKSILSKEKQDELHQET